MNTNLDNILEEIISSIDIPVSAYETAEGRYTDLGEWLSRPEASTHRLSPVIRPQGSFRIGTVNRPATAGDSYDLDLGCRFELGITKTSHTQHQLKTILGVEVDAYRRARRIEEKLEEKRRCWRLNYADGLSFHMDVVPSIPEDEAVRAMIKEAMIGFGVERELAVSVSQHNGAITDNTRWNYDLIDSDWHVSNSEGYALWFEAQMKRAKSLLEARALQSKVASIDKLKPYRWKLPLQRVVQLLKWHRDLSFRRDPDGKPVSIILTTLAAMAYAGETTLAEALENILAKMGSLVRPQEPRIPNPVNPKEDFADKWKEKPQLEHNFRNWLDQAKRDLQFLATSRDPKQIGEFIARRFGVTLGDEWLRTQLNFAAPAIITSTKSYEIAGTPARPWRSR